MKDPRKPIIIWNSPWIKKKSSFNCTLWKRWPSAKLSPLDSLDVVAIGTTKLLVLPFPDHEGHKTAAARDHTENGWHCPGHPSVPIGQVSGSIFAASIAMRECRTCFDDDDCRRGWRLVQCRVLSLLCRLPIHQLLAARLGNLGCIICDLGIGHIPRFYG